MQERQAHRQNAGEHQGKVLDMKRHLDRLILWFFYAAIVVVIIVGLWGWTNKIQWEMNR